ncbi:MAG TPA: hypothetical protein VHK70_05175 [Burkholderiaceae bacterium]|jgi:hypothetical protein|nr:hypothetical protein [Burkholderiaceae bacterium]
MNLLNKYRYRFITFGGMACPTALRSCRNACSINIAPLLSLGNRSAGLIRKKNASSMPKTKITGALFAEVGEQNTRPALHMHGMQRGAIPVRHASSKPVCMHMSFSNERIVRKMLLELIRRNAAP